MVIKLKIRCISSSSGDKPSCFKNLSYYFTEYCNNTSIHGLKFLGERGRGVVEKIWWLIFLGISLYFCILLNMDIYRKWEHSPVIVTFATSQTPIWEIPFPAVTICPEIKSNRNRYNFTKELLWFMENYDTDTDPERDITFGYMSLVCPTLFGFFSVEDAGSDIINKTAIDFLIAVASEFEDSMVSCRWLDDDLLGTRSLEEIFTKTLTSEGICYTFNLLDRGAIYTNVTDFHDNIGLISQDTSQWSVETGYSEKAELDTFPRRTLLSGMNGGLDILLKTNADDIDPLCGDSVQGYKIILHHPAEIPKASEQYFRVPLNQDVVAAIKPNMMTTSKDLRYYDPEDRQCYFVEEKKLRFFKIYNQQNCLLECLTNFTYEYCDCVGFYMPRDNVTEICGNQMGWCVSEASGLFLAQEVNVKLKSRNKKRKLLSKTKTDAKNINEECNCLPSCNSLEFETETSQSDWEWRTGLTLLNLTDEISNTHFSRLRIFFKDMQFITSERNQLYGQTDFLANCGGLLGLFTGFSFISMVEILYFLTLRLVYNINKFGRNYWSGASELLQTKNN